MASENHVNTCTYFPNIYCMYVYVYIIHIHRAHTCILCKQKLFLTTLYIYIKKTWDRLLLAGYFSWDTHLVHYRCNFINCDFNKNCHLMKFPFTCHKTNNNKHMLCFYNLQCICNVRNHVTPQNNFFHDGFGPTGGLLNDDRIFILV